MAGYRSTSCASGMRFAKVNDHNPTIGVCSVAFTRHKFAGERGPLACNVGTARQSLSFGLTRSTPIIGTRCCARAVSGRATGKSDELSPPHVLPSAEGLTLPRRSRKSRVVHHSNFGGQCLSWVKTRIYRTATATAASPRITDITWQTYLRCRRDHLAVMERRRLRQRKGCQRSPNMRPMVAEWTA
jgi:hypothetical protein